MNINHAVAEEVKGDKLKAIFDRQKQLWDKYHYIELRSGLRITEACPVNLDDRRGQFQLKDYAWRVTEELGEALDAQHTKDHCWEELIDGLHFLTEMTILAGRDYDTVMAAVTGDHKPEDWLEDLVLHAQDRIDEDPNWNLYYWVGKFTEQLGMMCNCLKNKPWKQSMMVTDQEAFYSRLAEVWSCYMVILVLSGMDAEAIVQIYLKKSQVNMFRQRSNY